MPTASLCCSACLFQMCSSACCSVLRPGWLCTQRDDCIVRCKAVSGLPSAGRGSSSGSAATAAGAAAAAAAAAKASAAVGVSQQVLKMEAETPPSAAFCFHPFKPLLTTVDLRGVVRVVSYQSVQAPDTKNFLDARAIVNRFHIARGAHAAPALASGAGLREPAGTVPAKKRVQWAWNAAPAPTGGAGRE